MIYITTEGNARPWGAFAGVRLNASVMGPHPCAIYKRSKNALRGEGRALPGKPGGLFGLEVCNA